MKRGPFTSDNTLLTDRKTNAVRQRTPCAHCTVQQGSWASERGHVQQGSGRKRGRAPGEPCAVVPVEHQHGSPPVPCSGSRAGQACSAHQFCSPSTRNKLPHPQLVNKYARHPRAFLDAFAAAYLKMASMNAVWQPYK